MTIRIHPISIPIPFPIEPVNAYLLPEEPVTLIDTGPRTPEARQAIDTGFAAAGLPPGALRRIILTHGHVDHFGYAAALARETGAAIYAHPAERSKVSGDRMPAERLLAFLPRVGSPDAAAPVILEILRGLRRLFDPITEFQPLTDGMRLAQGGGVLEVLHTPGHSSGHLALLTGDTLIAGDVLLEEVSANPIVEFEEDGGRVRTLPLLIRSLRRLAAIDPARVLPGHGGAFGPAALRIQMLLSHHAEREERVLGLLADAPRTPFALAQAMFPQADAFNMLLAVSEVIGHLDLLVEGHRAVEEDLGGVLHYRRIATGPSSVR